MSAFQAVGRGRTGVDGHRDSRARPELDRRRVGCRVQVRCCRQPGVLTVGADRGRLDGERSVGEVGLESRAVAVLPLLQEDRNCNRGQDADDDHDDQELDEREAALVLLGLADASEHRCGPFETEVPVSRAVRLLPVGLDDKERFGALGGRLEPCVAPSAEPPEGTTPVGATAAPQRGTRPVVWRRSFS